jgi:uncharacterized protein (TIRG00374 family)
MLVRVGPARLAGELAKLGWGFLIVLLLQAAPILLNTLSWSVLLPAGRRVPLSALAPMLLAGEALNTVSPVGFIGGEVVRVSLLRRRMPTAEAAGAVGLAAGTQFAGQILFLLTGFPFALALVHAGRLRTGIAIVAIAIAVLLTVLLAGALSPRCLALGGRVIGRVGFLEALLRRIPPPARRTIHGALETLRSHPGAFALSIAASFAAWQVGAVETFLILRLLGRPVGASTALAIEVLSAAIEGAFFFVPARMGTQEGGRALVFLWLGLDPAVGLALGLVRRAREIVWAVPGLVLLEVLRRKPDPLGAPRPAAALSRGGRPLPD